MEKGQIIFAVLFTTTVLLMLAFFLLLFFVRYRSKSNSYIRERENLKKEFEQTLLQSQIEIQENTFTALGHELHDNIGQLLVSAKLLIGVTQREIQNPIDSLNAAEETVGKAIKELRSLSKLLDKEWLEQFDFIYNLQAEVERIKATKFLDISFSHTEKIFLQPEEQIILFRIVQEALQNSIKHSKANKIVVSVSHTISTLMVSIIDNGKGFKDNEMGLKGLGLKNMKHRVHLLGGLIRWDSFAGIGTTVIINLPLKQ